MTYAAFSYLFKKPEYEGAAVDLDTLQSSLVAALDWHFPTWEDAAAAWDAYRELTEEIAGRENELLAPDAALAVELDNNPAAAAWASFLETAQDAGQNVYDLLPGLGKKENGEKEPFGFAIKFVTGADSCGRENSPVQPHGLPVLPPGKGR